MRTHDRDIAGLPTTFRQFNASFLDAAEPQTVEAPAIELETYATVDDARKASHTTDGLELDSRSAAITETEGERCELCGTTDARLDYTADGRVLACPPCRQRYEENA